MRPARAPLSAVLGLLLAGPAAAYQRDEHYYSTRLAMTSREWRSEAGQTAAMCAQLADEAPELNAIAVYQRLMHHPLDYSAWSLRGRGPDDTVGRMVTVQQLLHGLTGGSSSAAQAAATETARAALADVRRAAAPQERADALCALGFALHLYGDSHAHRRLRNHARMYRTGIGHLFDASTPDFPLSSAARADLWGRYLTAVPPILGLAGTEADAGPLVEGARGVQALARSSNSYARDELLRLEARELERRGVPGAPLERNLGRRPCQELVDAHAAKTGLSPAPRCAESWALFRDAAARAFEAYDADPAHAAAPTRDLRRPFFTGSPFAKGADW